LQNFEAILVHFSEADVTVDKLEIVLFPLEKYEGTRDLHSFTCDEDGTLAVKKVISHPSSTPLVNIFKRRARILALVNGNYYSPVSL
jgi:hypothetical protein